MSANWLPSLLLCQRYTVMHDISRYWYKCVPPGPVPSKNTTSSEEAREKSDAMPNISDVMLRKLKLHRGLPGWCVSSQTAAADTGFYFLLEKQIEVKITYVHGAFILTAPFVISFQCAAADWKRGWGEREHNLRFIYFSCMWSPLKWSFSDAQKIQFRTKAYRFSTRNAI